MSTHTHTHTHTQARTINATDAIIYDAKTIDPTSPYPPTNTISYAVAVGKLYVYVDPTSGYVSPPPSL